MFAWIWTLQMGNYEFGDYQYVIDVNNLLILPVSPLISEARLSYFPPLPEAVLPGPIEVG